MQVDYQTALEVFGQLPEKVKTPYHHPFYIVADALRNPELSPVFFIHRENEKIFYHAFHQGKVRGTAFFDIQSPYAYGGPLFSSRDALFQTRAWKSYLDWCREQNILAEFTRFHPLLQNWSSYPGESCSLRETVWIDLQAEDAFSSYSSRVRNGIRKALKNGLRVEWIKNSASLQTFAGLYSRAMERLQADRFYFFPREYFEKLLVWPESRLAFCFKGKEVLAAALFMGQAHIMEYHLAAGTSEGNKWNAGSLILHQAAGLARKLGCRFLHLGGGTDNRPDNSLFFFKAGFSRQRACYRIGRIIHRPRFYEGLKNEWQDRPGGCRDRILFYRFS